jgi:hypothetical protein
MAVSGKRPRRPCPVVMQKKRTVCNKSPSKSSPAATRSARATKASCLPTLCALAKANSPDLTEEWNCRARCVFATAQRAPQDRGYDAGSGKPWPTLAGMVWLWDAHFVSSWAAVRLWQPKSCCGLSGSGSKKAAKTSGSTGCSWMSTSELRSNTVAKACPRASTALKEDSRKGTTSEVLREPPPPAANA